MKNQVDGMDRHQEVADSLYERKPLEVPPGRRYASIGEQRANLKREEYFVVTGEQLEATEYRDLDDYPLEVVERIVDGDVQNRIAAARVSEDPDAEDLELAKRIEAGNQESRNRIISIYGKDGPKMLERVQR